MVSSVSDANLMFEVFLEGLDFDKDENIILTDEELASMRMGRAFLSHINSLPRSLKSMEQMVTNLKKRKPQTQTKFETLVLSMVYSAHMVWYQEPENQEAWGEVLRQLVNVTVYELRGNYLFNDA
ncbi:hypothetical protein Q8A73_004531 [Channa argus]|nr:hypothetical protein Q8A73_004531 [Channa argus]